MEIWKEVIGFEGLYEVSDLGRVKSVDRKISGEFPLKGGRRRARERILKQAKGKYCSVSLSRNGERISAHVHTLVLEAFVGPRGKDMECRHFPDRNTSNNCLSNLSWGTRTENQNDRIFHGTRNGWTFPKILSEDICNKIRLEYLGSGDFNRYKRGEVTQRFLADKYKVSLSTINQIIRST